MSQSERRDVARKSSVPIKDLTELLECPVCFDYILPPLFQCQSGHMVCNHCRSQLSACPTCRGSLDLYPSVLGNLRNLAMEKLAVMLRFPCKFASLGCKESSLLSTNKILHERGCEFRPCECPCPGTVCKWRGSLETIMAHLITDHSSVTALEGEDIVFKATSVATPGAVDWVMLQSCFGYNFMIILEKHNKPGSQEFCAFLRLIGTVEQAEKFNYKLELRGILNGRGKRLTWESTPKSIHDVAMTDCLTFDGSVAETFTDNEGNLPINNLEEL